MARMLVEFVIKIKEKPAFIEKNPNLDIFVNAIFRLFATPNLSFMPKDNEKLSRCFSQLKTTRSTLSGKDFQITPLEKVELKKIELELWNEIFNEITIKNQTENDQTSNKQPTYKINKAFYKAMLNGKNSLSYGALNNYKNKSDKLQLQIDSCNERVATKEALVAFIKEAIQPRKSYFFHSTPQGTRSFRGFVHSIKNNDELSNEDKSLMLGHVKEILNNMPGIDNVAKQPLLRTLAVSPESSSNNHFIGLFASCV